MADDKKDSAEKQKNINAEREYHDSLKKVKDVLNKALGSYDELASTTKAVNEALEKYKDQVKLSANTMFAARESLAKQETALLRLENSLGVYKNTLGGIIAVTKQSIAAAKQREVLYAAEVKLTEDLMKQVRTRIDKIKPQFEQDSQQLAEKISIVKDLRAQRLAIRAEIDAKRQSVLGTKESIAETIRLREASVARRDSIHDEIAAGKEREKSILSKLGTIAKKESRGEDLSPEDIAKRKRLNRQLDKNSELMRQNESALVEENKKIFGFNGLLTDLNETVQAEESSLGTLREKHLSLTSELDKVIKETRPLWESTNAYKKELNAAESELAKLEAAYEDQKNKLAASKELSLNEFIEGVQKVLQSMHDSLKAVVTELDKLVTSIRNVQQSFGLAAGSAAKLQFQTIVESVKTYASAVLTLGQRAAVSAEEIQKAQSEFQSEFGGILTAGAATDIARQAKEMGVGVGELAKARRVFMTQTMGNANEAKRVQDRFVAEFAKKGLSAKDAMEAIGQNAELLARNGTRFATSFARAAADAKKIGVDLSKVDQIGDNIIGNFEGFLESQAELGAMGFGFDGTRLAELAETGDTGALMNELRSQLASTGKDITKLRRSEQLALSQAFGVPMAELQRLAGKTAGAGEETLSPEELQKDANKSLGRLVNFAEGIAATLGVVVTILGVIASNTAMAGLKNFLAGKIGIPTSLTGPMAGGVGSAIKTSVSAVSRVASSPVGGGVIAGLLGGVSGFKTARESGKGRYEATGAGLVQGGLAAGGAVLGATLLPFLGPIGPMIGGYLGNTIGKALNKYFPSLAGNIGLLFKGFVSAFEPLKKMFVGMWENIKKLGEPLSKIMNLFGGTTDKAGNLWPVMEKIGYVLGTAFQLAIAPLSLLFSGISLGIGLITSLAQLLTGDFAGAWQTVKDTLYNSFAWIVDPIINAVNAVKGVFASMINWIIDKINILPGIEIPRIGGEESTGDDVVSKSGYGTRSLVTPTQTVALNNNDTVVAYADDLISNAASTGLRMFGLGELANSADKQNQASAPVINVDLTRLEAKLDQVVRAIGSMQVNIDGTKAGRILVTNSEAATSVGVLRPKT